MSTSNITAIVDQSIMPFGKYKGQKMANIPAKYLLWLYNEGCDHAAVKQYIINNLDILNKEVSGSKK